MRNFSFSTVWEGFTSRRQFDRWSPITASAPIGTGAVGLGLNAQQAAVLAFINDNAELVAEFTEVESGKRADRPELAEALEACRRQKAKLVIAKLDRLSRNLAFIATLMSPASSSWP